MSLVVGVCLPPADGTAACVRGKNRHGQANDDFEAEVKLVQLLHNGAQLDIRLSEPAEEPLTVSIEFFASEAV